MRKYVLSIFVIALLFAPRMIHAQDVGLPIGTVAKPVVLEDLDGKAVDLGQYIGKKPVLLEFWATWCPLCKALEPKLSAARKQVGNDVEFFVVAVGVSQTPSSIRRHIASHPQPGRVLWDGKGAAVRAFDAPTTSYVVLLDRTGKVVYTGAGSDQNVVAAVGKARGAASR